MLNFDPTQSAANFLRKDIVRLCLVNTNLGSKILPLIKVCQFTRAVRA